MNKIQQQFKAVRVAKKISQEQLAALLKCSRVSVAMYETGKTMPGSEIYARLLEIKKRIR